MQRVNKKILIILICLSGIAVLHAEEPGLLSKKEKKAINLMFGPETNVQWLDLPDSFTTSQTDFRTDDAVYSIVRGDSLEGYLLSTRAKGRFEYYDYNVLYSDELKVLGTMVTVYRSTHGAGICQKKWLRQFNGYDGGELTLGKEIDAVSGGTLSALSMVEGIQRCHNLMTSLRNERLID